MRIDACFDSHVHWAATGEFAQALRLDALRSADDVTSLTILPHHHRGDWLLGFGWDDAAWATPPHRSVLDAWRPGRAIVLTKKDGHSRWLSTEAMRRAGLLEPGVTLPRGAYVARDESGRATGVISDRATDLVDAVLPKRDHASIRRDLLAAVRTFNHAGFTHVRDLTCDEAQWREAAHLDEAGLLTMAVDEYFWVKDAEHVDPVIASVVAARTERTTNLRACGIKIFYDGSLGGEGALISRCYHGSDHRGLELWTKPDLSRALVSAWARDLEVAIHVIGDEAADRVVDAALHAHRSGVTGRLHLEHVQLLRPETIAKLKMLNVRCHLQPSHWLGDRVWMTDKIGDLARLAFPWRALQEADVPFHFGSDAPIVAPSVADTLRALDQSVAAGIPRLLGRADRYLSYPDPARAPSSFTVFDEDDRPRQVVFRGEDLI